MGQAPSSKAWSVHFENADESKLNADIKEALQESTN